MNHLTLLGLINPISSRKYLTLLFTTLLLSFISFNLMAAVGITTPSLTISTCTFPSAYNTLGNIVINESANTDFPIAAQNTDYTFVISAPANFEFQATVGTITNTGGGDITTLTMVVSANTITVTYRSSDANRTNEQDIITITGIQVRAITGIATQTATKSASSELIVGFGNGTVMANLTSQITPSPSITGQPANQSVTSCTNATFTTTATGGGLTYQWQEFNGTVWTNLANGGVYNGVNTTSLTLTNPGTGLNSYKYRCIVSGTCTPSATTDGNATLTVSACAAVYCTPTYTSACSSSDFINNFSTTGGSANITNNASGCNGQANNYIFYSGMTVTQTEGLTFNISVQSGSSFGQGFRIWVDWNNDGDFIDANENTWNSTTSGTGVFNGVITIPSGTLAGIKRMRVRCAYNAVPTDPCSSISYGETEDYNVNVVAGTPMAISSMTVTQSSTAAVANCSSNAQIVRLEVTTTGSSSPISLTQIQTAFTGSAPLGGITSSKIYYTGTSTSFATTTLFGSASPAAVTYSINGSQTLTSGTNYFWLVYDLNSAATNGTTVDALISQFTAGAVNYTSASSPAITVTDPAGSRSLTLCLAPGGVLTGLETWVRADIGASNTGTGTAVTAWTNQNATGTGVLVNGAPTFNSTTTAYNYNPYVEFSAPAGTLDGGLAANRQFLKLSGYSGINGIEYKSLFFTFQLNDLTRVNTHCATVQNVTFSTPANGTWHGDDNAGSASILLEAYDISDFGTSSPAGTWQRNALNIASNSIHTNTKQVLSAFCQTGGSTTLNAFLGGQNDQIPASSFAGHVRDWKGPAAEIIGYTTTMTATERQKIHSYLAIKYGITLTQNYLATNGSTVFVTAAPYNNNIIGIGRDDSEALTQKQSHNDDDAVRIYMNAIAANNQSNGASFTNDISYVVTGATTGALCATAASVSEMPTGLMNCTLYSRIEREWRVTRTNMAQNFNMDFRLSSCANLTNVTPADLRFLVDDDGNFANGGTTCYYNGDGTGIVISYSNPTITITGISTTHIGNNLTRFITIASIQQITPLPVELLEFTVTLNENNRSVDLNWSTASEINSDYFIIDKSVDATNWETIGITDAAGNSTVVKNYYLLDPNPFLGKNYYRLKQVDNDGAYEYSDIRVVDLNELETTSIFPNPASNTVSIFKNKLEGCEIVLFDSFGKEISMNIIASGKNLVEFDLSNLADGIYYVQISDQSTSEMLKLIVRK